MEEAQRFLSEFYQCVQYHVDVWSTRAIHEVTHFSDVEHFVATELEENQRLRERIAEARELAAQQQSDLNARLDAEKRKTADMRRNFAIQAKPLLERYDSISLAKHYYGENVNLVAQQEHQVSYLHERETSNYGYQSKKLISLGLSIDTLRQKMFEGSPFARELQALLDDADSADVGILSAPLQGVAATGLPKRTELRSAAFSVASAMEEAAKFRPSGGAPSLFDMFKFRSVVQPGASQTHQMQAAMARDAAKLFLSKVDKEDWAGALQLADNDFSKSTTTASRDVPYQEALVEFKRVAMPHTAATQFLTYAGASLTSARMAFVEQMLKLE